MGGFRTQSDLIVKVLGNLGIPGSGQTPEVEDVQRVQANIQSIIDDLAGREVVYVPDLNNISNTIFIPLAKIVAYEMKDEFGVIGDAEAALEKSNTIALMQMRVINRARPTYEPLKSSPI